MKRILIVEDELAIAELQRDYLEVAGYHVEIEERGDRGLELALREEWDLLILDVMLPETDGFEICRHVRSRKELPILLVTAKQEEIDKIRGLGLGADDYVTKPFSPSELVARVRAHLARYERLTGQDLRRVQARSEQIAIGGLHIDKGTRQVAVNERDVSLTSKEFDLLVFLALHPNRVFTRDELFERVWGLDSAGDVATVTVHVRKLREKIEPDPKQPQYIETIWGVGYRLKA